MNYAWCCAWPPRTKGFNEMCWAGDGGNPHAHDELDSNWYTYARCCDIQFGPAVRYLPALDTDSILLHYGKSRQIFIDIEQTSVADLNNNSKVYGTTLPTNKGYVWNDKAARALLSTDTLAVLRRFHRRPLRLLDLGSGVGLTVVAAAMSGFVDLAVGVDWDPGAIAQASRNAVRNGLGGPQAASNASTVFLRFDICQPASRLRRLLRVHRSSVATTQFDVFTMSSVSVPNELLANCVYELFLAMAGPHAVYVDSDSIEFRSLVPPPIQYIHYYLDFEEFMASRGYMVLVFHDVDTRALLATDEDHFYQILPVRLWAFNPPWSLHVKLYSFYNMERILAVGEDPFAK